MREPYIVLGQYIPTIWEPKAIGQAILKITKAAGLLPASDAFWGGAQWGAEGAEVRGPMLPPSTDDTRWHRDGDINWVPVVWASNFPTEIVSNPIDLIPSSTIFRANPYEIIAFNNLEVLHRRPPEAEAPRWFFRQPVRPTPELLKQIAIGTLREEEV